MMNKTLAKVKIKYNSEVNQCPTCGEVFESIYAFDYHRTGKVGVNRRCLTISEMLGKGMEKNKYDRWISSISRYSYRNESDLNEVVHSEVSK